MQTRLFATALLLSAAVVAAAQAPDKSVSRPKITGVSHLAVYASDPAAADHFYREIIGAVKQADPENKAGVRYAINDVQFVEVLPLPADAGKSRMDHFGFNTDDAEGMRKYLASKSWKVPAGLEKGSDGSRWFMVSDPEGNKVEFVQPPAHPQPVAATNLLGRHIIHVGMVIHNRALEDTFYRDLLGFRPYWYGGMKEDRVQWVSQQTPNSHDWIEYMISYDPDSTRGIPASMSQHDAGVLNHLAIGVVSVPDVFKSMQAANRLNFTHDPAPKVGRDGKYQFNMYDPDGTRVEMMNFHATEKPCCSEFTAEDPSAE